nr:DUF4430 domain-containing protein [Maliibacterium massiliense]
MKKHKYLIALLLALALALTGCAGGAADAPALSPQASAAPAPSVTQRGAPSAEAQTPSAQASQAQPEASAQPAPSSAGQGAKVTPARSAAQAPSNSAPAASAAPTPAATPVPTPAPTPTPEKQTVSCSVAIDTTAAAKAGLCKNNALLGATRVELPKGSSVYDALRAAAGSISVAKQGSGSRVYVTGIGGISEGDAGGQSGWMYSVNGAYVQKSCGAQIVQEGDRIVWRYTTNSGKDIGGGV